MSNLRRDLILWSDTLQDFHLPRWEELPNFDLYLDQVITLIEGYLQNLFDEENDTILTAAMINNYVKLKLIPKAEKKRYNRMHIAYLIAITILKQVLTIPEVRDGIVWLAEKVGPKQAYNLFCQEQERELSALFQPPEGECPAGTEVLALRMAARAFASKRMAEKMLELEYTLRQ